MYQISSFGKKLTEKTGILELMDDLGRAMAGDGGSVAMLGGGNPAHVPGMLSVFRERMRDIVEDPKAFARMVGNYTTPQGDAVFLRAYANLLRHEYGWNVTEKNIALVSGSQTAFFFLFNLLAGQMPDGMKKKIFLPIVPEYIGYADQGICEDFFVAQEPMLRFPGEHRFKYAIDVAKLAIPSDAAAICVSRPTNPSGNVISDREVCALHVAAQKHKIPLIIDNAYGAPAPNIMFVDTNPIWDEHIIHSMSLSKLGLPGLRSSIVVASEEIIEYLASINAIIALAGNNVGSALTLPMIESGEIVELSKKFIMPFYRARYEKARTVIENSFPQDVPYYVHEGEGALFLWLWFKNLPITSHELYQRLKKKGVLVVPGNYFFPGHKTSWQHKDECIRISYAQDENAVAHGIEKIGEELTELYLQSLPRKRGLSIKKAAVVHKRSTRV
jgi:valine--pyruvate aminotransferase